MKYQFGKVNPVFVLVALFAISVGVYVQLGKPPPAPTPEFKKLILLPTPRVLPSVTFTDHRGDEVTTDKLKGQWSVLFFGFTHCPDVCPTTMQTLKQVKQRVSEAGYWDTNQVIMITVDPERDTVERLANYVPFFDDTFIGLRASLNDTVNFAKQVGVLFIKGDTAANGGYDVDHSAALILINPQGQYAGVITGPHQTKEISDDLIKLAKYNGVTPSPSNLTQTGNTDTGQKVSSEAASTPIEVSNAWIRPAPAAATSMAAYFELSNVSNTDITITGVSSDRFDMAMMHESSMQDGMMSMNELGSLTLAAGASVTFEPMGKHIMLMGPKQPLPEGSSAEIELSITTGEKVSVTIPVKQPE